METFERIKTIIAETLNIEKELVTEDLSVGQIPQWDSMGNMAIISAIEENLNIEFPIEDLFELNSVKSLIEEVDKLL